MILVDDGSSDGTSARLSALAETRPEIRVLTHRRNAGQSAAVASGFAVAAGRWVSTLDGDGQNDPADLLPLLRRAEGEQVDCVTGVRQKRRDSWPVPGRRLTVASEPDDQQLFSRRLSNPGERLR